MLKLLSCAQGHYWEDLIGDSANGTSTPCPVCGQNAETAPLLDLAPSPEERSVKTPPTGPPTAPPLRNKEGRPIVAGCEILSDLGRTTAGVRIYRARQILINRIVTLRVVMANEDAGQLAWGSLRGEATALGRLAHPNIVQILEAGERERQLFFNAMEYVNGPSLSDILSGKPLPYRQALFLVEIMARAVHHAHEKNVLHRGLKPRIILLHIENSVSDQDEKLRSPDNQSVLLGTMSCVPKIADFGLARRPVEGDAADVELQGECPSYLAPEQVWGTVKDIGPATDVYALGAILYELISGRPPFREATPEATLDAIQTRPPPPLSGWRSWVPRDVEAICRKSLAKQPRRRYASAMALAEDLRRRAEGYPVSARTPGFAEHLGRRLRRKRRGVALMMLGVVVGALLFALLPPFTLTPTQFHRLGEQSSRQRLLDSQADQGQRIAFLESELRQTRQNENYLRNFLLAQRALATGDKDQSRKMLDRCAGMSNWEWDFLNGQLQEQNQSSVFQTDLPVLCMALNGQYLVAGGRSEANGNARGEKGEVSVWDVQTRNRTAHPSRLRFRFLCSVSIAFSPGW